MAKKKKGGEVTLAEHARRIAPLGGKASMEGRSEEERQEFARSGGRAGGPARAHALSPARRKAIAKKAAAARWGKKGAK
jgi:hypothetical protein